MQNFPQGIATHHAFCNRDQERQALKKSIESHEHLVLVGPRRYGKTSLITQVLKENEFPGVNIDFFFSLSQNDVAKAVNEGVSKVISSLLPKIKSAGQKIIESVMALNPKLNFNLLGQQIEINTRQTTEKSISEVLLALDHFAEKAKKSCVIVFDEFQQIGELKENHAIEAAIRHAVERSQFVSYVFCGSKRHLLNEMFTDKSRPLYHLCDLMTIHRISSPSYHAFLNKRAKQRWKKTLEDDLITEILDLTENHPYYVNALCRRLWRSEKIITMSDIRNTWNDYVKNQSIWISNDLSNLTLNRRKVLSALAHQPTNEPQGHSFSKQVGLNPSAIKKCLVDLQKLDMIYLNKNKYFCVLDPAITYFIRQRS